MQLRQQLQPQLTRARAGSCACARTKSSSQLHWCALAASWQWLQDAGSKVQGGWACGRALAPCMHDLCRNAAALQAVRAPDQLLPSTLCACGRRVPWCRACRISTSTQAVMPHRSRRSSDPSKPHPSIRANRTCQHTVAPHLLDHGHLPVCERVGAGVHHARLQIGAPPEEAAATAANGAGRASLRQHRHAAANCSLTARATWCRRPHLWLQALLVLPGSSEAIWAQRRTP